MSDSLLCRVCKVLSLASRAMEAAVSVSPFDAWVAFNENKLLSWGCIAHHHYQKLCNQQMVGKLESLSRAMESMKSRTATPFTAAAEVAVYFP